VNEFVQKQFEVDPATQKAGPLSRDNTLRTLRNTLQSSLQFVNSGKFRNIAEVGITTDPKTGSLKLDDAKLKKALSEDYLGVAQLFVQSPAGNGIGTTLSDAVKGIQNNQDGVLPSKDREFKRLLENMDEELVRKERQIGQKAEGIKRKFAALESTMNNMRGQSQAIAERLGVSGAPMPGLS
jgi:flagellar hook-associated protein 2